MDGVQKWVLQPTAQCQITIPSINKTIIFQRDVCKLALRAEAPIFT